MQNMILYCLDNSDAACRSEDFPCGNRLGFQLNFVRTVSRSVLAPQQGQQTESISNAQLALVSSAGRPHLSVAPTTNAGALLGLDPDLTRLDGERCQFLGALRLALLAVKRSPTARVLAFLASQADLPAEQCRQLSHSFAEAGVPLDVVVLCPTDELHTELLTSLELLTAAPVYEQPSTAGPTAGPQRPGPRRPGAPGARAPAAAIDPGATAAGARQPAASIAAAVAAATTGGGSQAPGAGQAAAAAPPRGQRLLHFPPPDPSMALWQQMEPLLELLQIEGQPGGLEPGAEPGAAVPEDDRGILSQLRTGRPPLPRPPRSAGAGAAASSSGPGQRPPGLASSGPLPNRSSTRGGAAGTCRYESLDSLQHLSLDGFLRSWLPSYANYSRVLQVPTAQQQQGGDGGGGGASAGLGPGRLCYISVYRLQLPRWHKLCEVHAGCMYETEGAPEGAGPPPSPSASTSGAGGASGTEVSVAAAAGATAASVPAGPAPTSTSCLGGVVAVAAATAAAAQPSAAPAAARSAVVVPRAAYPVQVHFSTRCSSAAAAAAVASSSSSFVAAADGGGAARCRWVCADPRRGSLSLVASVEDPGVVKLLWSERQQLSAAQQPQYGSIFASAEDSGGVEPTAAELELTLSPTRTQFRVVPHVKGGAVLEVLSPRSVVHRPRQSHGNSAAGPASSSSSHQAAGPAQAGPAQAASSQPSSHQQLQHRYFFWLQQDWSAEGTAEAAAAVPESRRAASIAEGVSEDGEPGGGGAGERGAVPLPLPDRGCRALADHLQALLECPPEFDAHKHGNRVRCSSTPLQLGPLPFALIEEILRASGRQLHPDGTLALAATTSTIATAAAAPAAAAPAAAASSPSAAAARLQHPPPQQQQPASGSAGAGSAGGVGGGAAGGAAGGESRRRPAGDVVALRREQRTAPGAQRSDGADGLCSVVMSGSPGTSAGVGPNAAAAAPHRRFPAAAAASAAAGAAPPWARSTRTSERRGIVQGFSRTTYSRPAAAPTAAAAAPAASTMAAAAAAKGQGQATLSAAAWQAAAKALCSHPLADDFDDDSDWGSDCDSPAAGTSVESSAAPTPRAGFYAGDVQAACQGGAMAAGPSRDDAGSAAASPLGSSATAIPGAERTPTEAACLPGGCTRGDLAAAAAVAAAAAAVGSSGASLVAAAVEPEGGGSCPEDSSLMFELD